MSRLNPFVKSSPLCEKCAKINFSQFDPYSASRNKSPEQHSLELKHLLAYRATCNFCALLFKALCLPENDPLRDPELQQTIQQVEAFTERLRDNAVAFENWAEVRKNFRNAMNPVCKNARWPFGRTKDNLRVVQGVNFDAEMTISHNGNISSNAHFEDKTDLSPNAVVVSETTEKTFRVAEELDNNEERKRWLKFVRDMLPDPALYTEMTRKALPATLLIILYGASHKNSGLMEVALVGCTKGASRDLKALSHFRLRVASPEVSTKDKRLRYGKILDKSKIDMALCRKWVEHCRAEHGGVCNNPSWSQALPKRTARGFRLIDIHARAIAEPNMNSTDYEYAALSYVWGKQPTHKDGILSLQNKDRLMRPRSIDDGHIGKAVADAIEITRKLGLRYLWVDRLCIVQDQGADKEQQVAQMDRTYGNAVVTIVAASGKHFDEPILGITAQRSISQLAEQVTKRPEINVLVPFRRNTSLQPWSTRAWTLQEKLLSKRLLVFHDGTVDFYCPCGGSHEDMTAEDSCIGKPPPLVGWLSLADARLCSSTTRGLRLLRSSIFAQYAALIEQYSPRRVSDASDTVIALSGMLHILITNQQSSQRKQPPLSGLPEEFLDQALHWLPAAGENVCLQRRVNPPNSRNPAVTFPSWSWAAWTAGEENAEDTFGGVRYESPFRTQTDDKGGLRKIVPDEQDTAEEFMRPLMKWYVADRASPGRTCPTLRPLNKTGLGLALDPKVSINSWNKLVNAATGNLDRSMPSLDDHVARRLTDQHLIFRTRIAQFRLGETRTRTETTWKRNASGELVVSSQLAIRETPILDGGVEIGRAWLPDPDGHAPRQMLYDFALMSEAQYFGDEKSVDFTEYPLFNVMLLRRDASGGPFASRMAMGRVTKDAWWGVASREEVVVLG